MGARKSPPDDDDDIDKAIASIRRGWLNERPSLTWVGPRYNLEGLSGVRLLILGEAWYSGDEDFKKPRRLRLSDKTNEYVIHLTINGPVRHRPFWTKVTKLLLNRSNGEPISAVERADLWNGVAFYKLHPLVDALRSHKADSGNVGRSTGTVDARLAYRAAVERATALGYRVAGPMREIYSSRPSSGPSVTQAQFPLETLAQTA